MKIKTATFVFSQDINDATVGNFIANLVSWAQSNEKAPLQIILNSGGGGVLAAIALYEFIGVLQTNGHKVTIAVMGRAGSAAAVVLQAADHRVIYPNSDLLIHAVFPIPQPSGTVGTQVKAEVDRSESLTNRTFTILVARSCGKLTVESIDTKTGDRSKDWWVNAREALDYGLVDEVASARSSCDSEESAGDKSADQAESGVGS